MDPIARFAKEGRLVAFVGAGVSVAPPTCLPSWWEVNQGVVNALAGAVRPIVGEERERACAEAVLARQRADRFPPEYQAEIIAGRLRDGYFRVLQCLDGDEPNASHLALAALARSGHVRAILTTNFDRVLEAAFRRLDTPLEVCAHPERFRELAADPDRMTRPSGPCRLLKIHGSAEDADTLVDTLSQRKRGLPPETSACIRHLLRFGHWLFLGFSGADLEADPGYLHLRQDRDEARGFTWLLRPGHAPLPAVRKTRDLYGDRASFVEGELPAWLAERAAELLGEPAPTTESLSEEDLERRQAAASEQVVGHTTAWAEELGRRRAAVVMSALLEAVGAPRLGLELLTEVYETASDEDRSTGTFALVCDSLGSLHRERGENARAVERFDEARRIFGELGAEEQRRGIGNNLALSLVDVGRYDEALALFEETRAIASETGDAAGEAVALHNVGLVHRSRGSYGEAARIFEEELVLVAALGDERGRATVLNALGDCLARLDRHDEALSRLEEALPIVERLGDDRGRAHVLGNTASVHHARADFDDALRIYDEVLELFEELDDVGNAALTLLNIASVRQHRGELEAAIGLADRAAARAEEAGLHPLRARALSTAGAIQRDAGEPARAVLLLGEALKIRTEIGDESGRADTLNDLGIAYRAMGLEDRARRALEEALSIRTDLGEARARTETLTNLGLLARDEGDLPTASRLLLEVVDTLRGLGLHDRAGTAAFNLGAVYLDAGEPEAAAAWFGEALAVQERIGNPARATTARLAMAWARGLQGRVGEALAIFEQADRGAGSPGERAAVADRMLDLARVYADQGHGAEAGRLVELAEGIRRDLE